MTLSEKDENMAQMVGPKIDPLNSSGSSHPRKQDTFSRELSITTSIVFARLIIPLPEF